MKAPEIMGLSKRVSSQIKRLRTWLNYLYQEYGDYPSARAYNIQWKKTILSELEEARYLVMKFNANKSSKWPVIPVPIYEINNETTIDDLTAMISSFINRLEEIEGVLNYSLHQLSKEDLEVLQSLKTEIDTLLDEGLDTRVYKNLRVAIEEAETEHYLAASLISARVIIYCIEQIIGKDDEAKIEELVKQGVIPKDEKSKETMKQFIKAVKSARHATSHRIDYFPQPSEMFTMIGDAVKVARITHKYIKVRGDTNG